MKRIVFRFGLASGVILLAISAAILPLCLNGTLGFDQGQFVGFTIMILAFMMVFFGIRSYRDTVAGGVVGFGKAFQVGILITLITCAVYVVVWEIAYFNFFPDFLDKYSAHTLAKMHAAGESEAAIRKATEEMASLAKVYDNVFINSGITFLEIFPVGLIVTLVSAGILRRKPRQDAPEAAVAA